MYQRPELDREMEISKVYWLHNKAEARIMQPLSQLRPKLASPGLKARKLTVFSAIHGDCDAKPKLEGIDPDTTADDRLYSELLLTCFETQASTEII